MSITDEAITDVITRLRASILTMTDTEVDMCLLTMYLYNDKTKKEDKLKGYDEIFAEMAPLLNEELQHRIGKTQGTV